MFGEGAAGVNDLGAALAQGSAEGAAVEAYKLGLSLLAALASVLIERTVILS